MKLYSLLSLIIVFSACNKESSHSSDKKSPSMPSKSTTYKTNSGKSITFITTNPKGASLNDIEIETQSYGGPSRPLMLKDEDPLDTVYVADIDGDGYEEFYMIMHGAGSGAPASLVGLNSVGDRELKLIGIDDLSEDKENGKGFMGHDGFVLENNLLIREFPVYNETDVMAKPTGGNRKIYYKLINRAGEYVLAVDSVKNTK